MRKELAIGTVLASSLLFSACTARPSQQPQTTPSPAATTSPTTEQGVSMNDVTELQITDVQEGTGAIAKVGDSVSVHYTGQLTNGEVFDSSRGRGEPFTFTLGEGRVIEGWEQGIQGMKVGGQRQLVIPPSMAYGPGGVPPVIPGNATLIFDVELVEIGAK